MCRVKDLFNNSLRCVIARSQGVHCVAFLANSLLLDAEKRLEAYPNPQCRRLARFMQDILKAQRNIRLLFAVKCVNHYSCDVICQNNIFPFFAHNIFVYFWFF